MFFSLVDHDSTKHGSGDDSFLSSLFLFCERTHACIRGMSNGKQEEGDKVRCEWIARPACLVSFCLWDVARLLLFYLESRVFPGGRASCGSVVGATRKCMGPTTWLCSDPVQASGDPQCWSSPGAYRRPRMKLICTCWMLLCELSFCCCVAIVWLL